MLRYVCVKIIKKILKSNWWIELVKPSVCNTGFKISVGIVCFSLWASAASAQINPETAFYWENPYYISPASVNLDYKGYFSLAGRKQWAGLEGSPATFFATGALFLEDYRTQAAFKVLKDKIGYINTLDLSLSYTYSLRLSWHHFLNVGIAGAWQMQQVDRGKVVVENPDDPIFSSERYKGLSDWNFNLGVEYVYDRSFIAGIASQNLMSFVRDEPYIWGGVNYVYARYRTRSLARGFDAGRYRTRSFARSYDMEYGVCVKHYKDDLQVDGMISFYVNRETQEEKFQFSLLGRSVGEVGILFGFKLMSDLKMLCSYDYNFKTVSDNAYGSFEVMLTYPIHRTQTCRGVWDR